jgi:pimeloyl-ACP methyl ester carboxylesterase
MPQAAAGLLQHVFTLPPRPALRKDEHAVLSCARRWRTKVRGMEVVGYEWGEGPAVLLMHGWGGHAGHMSGLVEPLMQAGLRVIAIDAPGHGASPRGNSTILHFHEAIEAMARHAGLGNVHGLVAHSLGAAASTYALSRGLQIPRAVFIGPFTNFDMLWQGVKQRTGASAALLQRMVSRLEIRNCIGFDELDPIALAERLRTPLLVIHDAHDEQVGLAQGKSLVAHWPGARLHTTSGLGHLKILKDQRVIETALRFLLSRPGTTE